MTTVGKPEAASTDLTPTEAAWPFNSDSPHVAAILAEGRQVRTLLVDVTGLEWEEIAAHLDGVLESASRNHLVPIFLTDLLDVWPFRERGLVFDTIPRASAQAAILPDLDWPAYVERRRHLITGKWRPAASVRLGPRQG